MMVVVIAHSDESAKGDEVALWMQKTGNGGRFLPELSEFQVTAQILNE